MKRYHLILSLIIILCTLISCKKDVTTSGQSFSVKGSTAVNAGVTLSNNNHTYTTTSNSQGNFEFINVASGNYSLLAQRPAADSSFIANNIQLDIYSDTTLAPILLPLPVDLNVSQTTTQNSISMSWSQFSLPDYFYEYKVYRKTDPGLDQNSGQLVYVGTNLTDTSFTDSSLLESTTYYYRVYINNRFGNMAGSSIKSAKTTPGNLVVNGSFEKFNSDNSVFFWHSNSLGTVITDPAAPDGNHVLSLETSVYHYDLNFGSVYETVDLSKLLPDVLYEISAEVKIINLESTAECWIGFTQGNVNYQTQIIKIDSSTQKGIWTRVSNQFYMNGTSPTANLNILCMTEIPYTGLPYKVLIDNIKIQKVN